jgi:hypothetical protein
LYGICRWINNLVWYRELRKPKAPDVGTHVKQPIMHGQPADQALVVPTAPDIASSTIPVVVHDQRTAHAF